MGREVEDLRQQVAELADRVADLESHQRKLGAALAEWATDVTALTLAVAKRRRADWRSEFWARARWMKWPW